MRRYIEIYSIMLRNSLIRELSFKANFLLWMVVEVLWFCGQIVFFSIIFGNVDRIGDWSKWEVVLLVGTHQIIAQLFQAFFFVNVANIPELVRTGKLDSLLVLPIDSQFAVSTKQFGLDSVINAIVGAVVVCVSLSKLGDRSRPPPPWFFTSSRSASASPCITPSCSAWPRSASGSCAPRDWFTAISISSTSRVIPTSFSPDSFRFIFGWIIPVVIVANIPARLLIKSLGQPGWLMLQLVVASTIISVLSAVFWRFALRHYSSASS